ncbi:MAG: hypothetical protein LLF76_02685 [Planctomycetaceae bacterium]|nr:hypothetical protein [Planctomycetaceae bacterium]
MNTTPLAFLKQALPEQPAESAEPKPRHFQAKVLRVVDGDTALVQMPGGELENIRLSFANAPETGWDGKQPEPGSQWAKQDMQKMLMGKTVTVRPGTSHGPMPRDRYHRILADIDLPGRQDTASEYIRDQKYNKDTASWVDKFTVLPPVALGKILFDHKNDSNFDYYVNATGAAINRNMGGLMKQFAESFNEKDSTLWRLGDHMVMRAEESMMDRESPQEPTAGTTMQRIKTVANQMLTQPGVLAGNILQSAPLMGSAAVGTTLGGPAGGIILSAASLSGSNYEDLRKAGVSHEDAVMWGNFAATGEAVVEQLTFNRLSHLARYGKFLLANKLPKSARGPIIEVFLGGIEDFAVESTQEVVQQGINNAAAILARADNAPALTQGMPESWAGGAIMGPVMGRTAAGIGWAKGEAPSYAPDAKMFEAEYNKLNKAITQAVTQVEDKNVLKLLDRLVATIDQSNITQQDKDAAKKAVQEMTDAYLSGAILDRGTSEEASQSPETAQATPAAAQPDNAAAVSEQPAQEAAAVQPAKQQDESAVAQEDINALRAKGLTDLDIEHLVKTYSPAQIRELVAKASSPAPSNTSPEPTPIQFEDEEQATQDKETAEAEEIGPTLNETAEKLWGHITTHNGEVFADGRELNRLPDEALGRLYNLLGLPQYKSYTKMDARTKREAQITMIRREADRRDDRRVEGTRRFLQPKETPGQDMDELEDFDLSAIDERLAPEAEEQSEEEAFESEQGKGELTGWEEGFQDTEGIPKKGQFNPHQAEGRFESLDQESKDKINYVVRSVLKAKSQKSSTNASHEVFGTEARQMQESASIDEQGLVVVTDNEGIKHAYNVTRILPKVRTQDSKAPGGAIYQRRPVTHKELSAQANEILVEIAHSMGIKAAQADSRSTVIQRILRAQNRFTHTEVVGYDDTANDVSTTEDQSPEAALLADIARNEQKDESGEKASRLKAIVDAEKRNDLSGATARLTEAEKYDLRAEIDEYLYNPRMADTKRHERQKEGITEQHRLALDSLVTRFKALGMKQTDAEWAANAARRKIDNLGGNIEAKDFGLSRWQNSLWAKKMGLDFSPEAIIRDTAEWILKKTNHAGWSHWGRKYGVSKELTSVDGSGSSEFSRGLETYFKERGIPWLTDGQSIPLNPKTRKAVPSFENRQKQQQARVEWAKAFASMQKQEVRLTGKAAKEARDARGRAFVQGFAKNANKFAGKVFGKLFHPKSVFWDKNAKVTMKEEPVRAMDSSVNKSPRANAVDTRIHSPIEYHKLRRKFAENLIAKLENIRQGSFIVAVDENGEPYRVNPGERAKGKIVDVHGLPAMPGMIPYGSARVNQKLNKAAEVVARATMMEMTGTPQTEVDAYMKANIPTLDIDPRRAPKATDAAQTPQAAQSPQTQQAQPQQNAAQTPTATPQVKLTEAQAKAKEDFISQANALIAKINAKQAPTAQPQASPNNPTASQGVNVAAQKMDSIELFKQWRNLMKLKLDRDTAANQARMREILGLKQYNPAVWGAVWNGYSLADIGTAMLMAIDIRRYPGYTEFVAKLTAPYRKTLDLAVQINNAKDGTLSQLKSLTDDIAQQHAEAGEMAIQLGALDTRIHNYAPHIWEFEASQGNPNAKLFNATHLQERTFVKGGLIEGLAAGKKLKDPGLLEASYVARQRTSDIAILNRTMKDMVEAGVAVVEGQRVPDGWKKLVHPQMTIGELTQDGVVQRAVYMSAKDAGYLNRKFGVSKLKGLPGVKQIDLFLGISKQLLLNGSLFHPRSGIWADIFNTLKLGDVNPIRHIQEGAKMIEQMPPFLEKLVKYGLTLPSRLDYDPVFDAARPGDARGPKWLQGAHDAAAKTSKTFEDFVFGTVIGNLKAYNAVANLMAALKENQQAIADGKIAEEEIYKGIASRMNNEFGGQDFAEAGIGPTFEHVLKMGLLGPDWTISNLRTLYKSIWGKTAFEKTTHRELLKVVAMSGLASTVALNLLISFWDDDDFFERYKKAWKAGGLKWLDVDITPIAKALGSKERKYFNVIGEYKEPLKWLNKPSTQIRGKLSTILRPLVDAMFGEDFAHRSYTSGGELFKTGKTTSWQSENKDTWPIRWHQVPSWSLQSAMNGLPISMQIILLRAMGQADNTDLLFELAGLDVSTDYRSGKKSRK